MKLMKLMAALLAVALLIVANSSAEARGTKVKHQIQKHRVIRDVTPLYAGLTTQFSARRHHRSSHRSGRTGHARRGGGACDGFQRCRCGVTAARNFGISYAHNGWNLKRASVWAQAFPRTSFHISAAGVAPHHVLKVVGGSSCADATVTDEKGTYQRNVCNMTFVAVGGGGGTQTASHDLPRRDHKSLRRGGATRYAQAESTVDIYDHGSVH